MSKILKFLFPKNNRKNSSHDEFVYSIKVKQTLDWAKKEKKDSSSILHFVSFCFPSEKKLTKKIRLMTPEEWSELFDEQWANYQDSKNYYSFVVGTQIRQKMFEDGFCV